MNHDPNCIFCKIVAGQIPSRKVYEDDELFAFHDIAPWAPVHFLIIPKEHIATLYDTGDEHAAMLGRMMALAPRLARELGVRERFPGRHQHRARRPAGGAAPPHARDGRPQALAQGLSARLRRPVLAMAPVASPG